MEWMGQFWFWSVDEWLADSRPKLLPFPLRPRLRLRFRCVLFSLVEAMAAGWLPPDRSTEHDMTWQDTQVQFPLPIPIPMKWKWKWNGKAKSKNR